LLSPDPEGASKAQIKQPAARTTASTHATTSNEVGMREEEGRSGSFMLICFPLNQRSLVTDR
jgi:hypothetical protein